MPSRSDADTQDRQLTAGANILSLHVSSGDGSPASSYDFQPEARRVDGDALDTLIRHRRWTNDGYKKFLEINMKCVVASLIATSFLVSMTCSAQAPAGSTGECKDGTYTSTASKRGACAGHGGVKEWYGNASSKAEAAPATKSPPKTPASTTAAPASPPSQPAAAPAAKNAGTAMPSAAAAGGGPAQVWVNSKSKVYHCQGDRWYGKTKEGEYMSEAAAKAAGNRPDHGKACS